MKEEISSLPNKTETCIERKFFEIDIKKVEKRALQAAAKKQIRAEKEKKRREELEALTQEINNLKAGQKIANDLIVVQNNKIDLFGNLIIQDHKNTDEKIDNLQTSVDEVLSFTQRCSNGNRVINYPVEPYSFAEMQIRKHLN